VEHFDARALRCSKAHLYNILRGKTEGLPPLPFFHIDIKSIPASVRIAVESLDHLLKSKPDADQAPRPIEP